MQGVAHGLGSKKMIAAAELVRAAVGQARVQTDVFFVVREAPEGDAQLELFWNWRVDAFHELERDLGGHAAGRQFCQAGDTFI